jgi:alpha-mannosidase
MDGRDSDTSGLWSRREFIRAGGALTALAAAGAHGQPTEPPQSDRQVLHIIGHSHIDAAWLWPWRDGANLALTTFRSALDRMKETPGFCFSHSSAAHYRWVQRADPAMFDEVRQRIAEGRWEVVGGWPIEPDCNIPATESFVRHCLYGKRYFARELGVNITIGFNPDAFGHAAGLPTILRRAGYRYYVFERPQEREMDLPLLFWWEGPDGSRLLALRIYQHYSGAVTAIAPTIAHGFAPGFSHAPFFLGVGDHGGAVTREQIARVLALRHQPAMPELRWSTLAQFFAAIESSPAAANLPVIRGELQHHSRGCYSAFGEGKAWNRRAERALVRAEAISTAARWIAQRPYPTAEYTAAWWKVLFNQFHDLMAGTALYSDYQDVRDGIGFACETAQAHSVEALQSMAKRVDTRAVEESAVFLFNPLPWPRRAMVEIHAKKTPSGTTPISHLATADGSRIPLQWRPSDSMTNSFPRLVVRMELPALGYRVFTLAHGIPPESAGYRDNCTIPDASWGLSSFRADDGTELLASPVSLVVIADDSDTWGHGISQFRQELGRPEFVSAAVVEDGPVMRVVRQRARWRNSEIALDIARYADSDVVELRFMIDWREHEQMLKLEISTALKNPTVRAKVPGATISRSPNGDEEPYQDWVALEGEIGGASYTLGLINAATYSYDCAAGTLRTVLIRSAPFARHAPAKVPPNDTNAWQDQGRQERTFWLLAGRGDHVALNLDRRAEELQTPAEYVMDSAHSGTAAWEQSLLEVGPANISVLAIKQDEETGANLIVRLQEKSGHATTATLSGALLGRRHQVPLEPFQIKTLRVERMASGYSILREVSEMEEPIG